MSYSKDEFVDWCIELDDDLYSVFKHGVYPSDLKEKDKFYDDLSECFSAYLQFEGLKDRFIDKYENIWEKVTQ